MAPSPPSPPLLLLLLLPLAAALLQLPEPLVLGHPIHIPVLGDKNITSYQLGLPQTSRLSIDVAFDSPSAVPRLHFPRPVAVLHDVSNVPETSRVPQLIENLSAPLFQRDNFSVDTDAYNARLLRSGFVSFVRPDQAVSVYNVATLEDRGPFPNGTLTLTLLGAENPPFCAGFFSDKWCNSNGECRSISESSSSRCDCKKGFTAPLCTESLSDFATGDSNDHFDPNDFEVAASSLEEEYVVVVNPFKTVYVAFNYAALSIQRGGRYEFSVRILKGTISTQDKRLMRCEVAAAPEFQPNALPKWSSHSKEFKRSGGDRSMLEANVTFFAQGSRYIVALFADASHTVNGFNDSAAFSITTPQLLTQTTPASRQRFLPQAMLPVCLSLIFIAALAVLLVFWLDRRSGSSKMVDRLSEAELLRMYPAYVAESDEGECPICLSDMKLGDSLRALRCEHQFHAQCLDPWVTENRANCPTCRASVRVDHLSDNHREPVCSRNRSCWGFLFCAWRDGERGQREREQQQTQEQAETQQSLEPRTDNLQDGVRIAFPDRVDWPLQMRTASSTPRTQSTTHAASEGESEGTSMHTALDLSFGSNRREQRLASALSRPP